MKHKKAALLIVVAGMAVSFTGCGGGNDNIVIPTSVPTTTPTTSSTATPTPVGTATPTPIPTGTVRFAGKYTGAYIAIGSISGSDISGSFTGTAASNGSVTGTILQDNGATAPGTGSITSAGLVNLSASGIVLVPAGNFNLLSLPRAETTKAAPGPIPRLTVAPIATPILISVSYSTKINGTATLSNSDSVVLGTLLTTQSNDNNQRGRFVAIRNMATPSVYAGTYSGSTNAAVTSTGEKIPAKLAFTVSANGLISGTYARTATGVRIRPLVGTIDASGKATLLALSEEENPVGSGTFTLVVTTLAGQGKTSGGVKISGTLNRVGTSAVNASGTFTATRTSTSTSTG